MKRFTLALALIASIAFLTLPTSSQGLLVVQRKIVTSTAPPLPTFDASVVGVWSLWNWNPVGYPAGHAVTVPAAAGDFSSVAPYPVDYTTMIESADAPPYITSAWRDQNSNTNDLVQAVEANQPTLQVTSSVLVAGAGTAAANGVYTYRGQFNGANYYNLLGQATSTANNAIFSDGVNSWNITTSGGAISYSAVITSFPWQADWSTYEGLSVVVGTQGGAVVYATSTCLQSSGALYSGGSATGQIYLLVKAGSLAETSVILESGDGAAGSARRISIRIIAGLLSCSIFDATAVACLPNTKTVTIADTNWHWVAFGWDTGQATPANQTVLRLDNSLTGVASPASADCAGLLIGNAVANIGSRNQASNFFTGQMRTIYGKSVLDNASIQTGFYNYGFTYLQSLAP